MQQTHQEGLFKPLLLGPHPGVLTWWVWGEAWEFGFLTKCPCDADAASPETTIRKCVTFCENSNEHYMTQYTVFKSSRKEKKKIVETRVTANVGYKLMRGYEQVSTKTGKQCNVAEWFIAIKFSKKKNTWLSLYLCSFHFSNSSLF